MYPIDIREEELKLRVAKDWFTQYDTTRIIGSIDFCVAVPNENSIFKDETESLLWGEAKQGTAHDIFHSFVQLILTIGKARTFDKFLPPQFLAAFDAARFAFIPYHAVQDVFYQNDFNWNVTPSDHNTKEFLQLYALVEQTLKNNAFTYNYIEDGKALRMFIKQNLVLGKRKTKRHKVSKNNFTFVYQRWCDEVKKSIQIDWDSVKEVGLLDADFFLADLLSKDGSYLLDSLYVLLKHDHYQFDRYIDTHGLFSSKEAAFKDNMQAHIAFWNKYERPPKREYWSYIVSRRDLLVPQDVRERKGSFFTPKQWVELSQEYLARELGEDWQDNYYIWDCCAGTGNLLVGLTNPANIWASTLDKADVDVMHERVRNGARLFDNHIFQFDFLNDDFSKLPDELKAIIDNPDKRRKLVIYINPPYAEASNARQRTGTGENRPMLAKETAVYKKYFPEIKTAARELFAQFFIRIFHEIPGATLAEFSTLKILQASNFADFRQHFKAFLLNMFIVPAATFDNVKGKFPIGFMIWQLNGLSTFKETLTDIYNAKGDYIGQKYLVSYDDDKLVIEWLRNFYDLRNEPIAYLRMLGTDMQNNNGVFITSKLSQNDIKKKLYTHITRNNVIPMVIYCVIRHVVEETWYNDRDQFCFPIMEWQNDKDFQLDALVYFLFCNSNRISADNGTNHWIPFYEHELGITEGFASHFMQDFLRDFCAGKVSSVSGGCNPPHTPDLFTPPTQNTSLSPAQGVSVEDNTPIVMSEEAQAVMTAGREIYRYYHAARKQRNSGFLNASLYDIKDFFKGRKPDGTMKPTSDDNRFNDLMDCLRTAIQQLARNIQRGVYVYHFLKI